MAAVSTDDEQGAVGGEATACVAASVGERRLPARFHPACDGTSGVNERRVGQQIVHIQSAGHNYVVPCAMNLAPVSRKKGTMHLSRLPRQKAAASRLRMPASTTSPPSAVVGRISYPAIRALYFILHTL